MAETDATRVDTFIARLKNHRLISALVICGIIVVGLASFSDAVSRLVALVPHRAAAASTDPHPTVPASTESRPAAAASTDPIGLAQPLPREIIQQRYFSKFADEIVRLDLAKLWYDVQWKDHFREERSRQTLVTFGRNILRSVDRDAVLFVYGDEDFFPLVYAQEREYLRRDVVIVHFALLRLPGYRDYVLDRLGLSAPPPEEADYDVVVRTIIRESHRPKFFSVTVGQDPVTEFGSHLSLEGLVWRYDASVIDGPRTNVSVTVDLLERRYDLRNILLPEGRPAEPFEVPLTAVVIPPYAFSFGSLADAESRNGDSEAAGRHHEIAVALDPSQR
jgi:hypothetical protein